MVQQWSILHFIFRSVVLNTFLNLVKSDPGPYSPSDQQIIDPYEVPAGEVTTIKPPKEAGPFADDLAECLQETEKYKCNI